jgi:zinc-ribbon domain/emp24/gp25L/p24 family/GOLD
MFCPACGKEIPEGSAFCMACGRSTAIQSPVQVTSIYREKSSTGRRIILGFLALLATFGFAIVILNFTRSGPIAFSPTYQRPVTYVPHIDKLVSGQNTVKARGLYWVSFKVDTTRMTNVRVVGRFSVSGGSGNDIEAVLTDEDDFENWKNGHAARALYSTGKTTVGAIDVSIPTTGTYYLGFSNRFSTFAPKSIDGNVDFRYTAK